MRVCCEGQTLTNMDQRPQGFWSMLHAAIGQDDYVLLLVVAEIPIPAGGDQTEKGVLQSPEAADEYWQARQCAASAAKEAKTPFMVKVW